MHSAIFRHTFLGLGTLLAFASISEATCDPAFNSNSISVAPSGLGHIAASRGMDGIIRVSELDLSTGTWRGWLNLSKTTDPGGSYSDAWVQGLVAGAGNYVYATKGDSLIQWRLAAYSGTFAVFRSALSAGTSTIQGRPASAQLSTTVKTAVAANFGGTIRLRKNTTAGWTAWEDLSGLSNAKGSPWMTQLPSNQVNLYVQTNDQKIMQNWWNGTNWSGWMNVVPSGANSEPASVFNPATSMHYLYFLGSNNVATQWTYDAGWTSIALTKFPGKRSFSAVLTSTNGAMLYAQDYQGNTFSSQELSRIPTTFEVNCVIPK